MKPIKDRMVDFVRDLQTRIVTALEALESQARFQKNEWTYANGGGGGITQVISNGKIFEKGGVNTSAVFGELSPMMVEKLGAKSAKFFATGISIVLHPHSPQIPTIHMNVRYFEQADRAWFGGGTDLTPYTYSEEDFVHFHSTLKRACDSYRPDAYAEFKKKCDEYFYLPHREECRGIGGIFFDYQSDDLEKLFEFVRACGNSFLDAYLPIVERNLSQKFSEREKKFQLLRRGRYVEFNLIHDRGTLFGLQTKGPTESILMSLPPVVHFEYKADLETTESEKQLMEIFRHPREWIR